MYLWCLMSLMWSDRDEILMLDIVNQIFHSKLYFFKASFSDLLPLRYKAEKSILEISFQSHWIIYCAINSAIQLCFKSIWLFFLDLGSYCNPNYVPTQEYGLKLKHFMGLSSISTFFSPNELLQYDANCNGQLTLFSRVHW